MRRHSKNLSPIRCNKHKDYHNSWVCGNKCLKNPPTFLKIYYPYDYTYSPNQGFLKSNIRYLVQDLNEK